MNDTPIQSPEGAERCVPFVFGITAHRDLRPADEPALRAAVRGIIDRFHARYPHTPMVILCALAEGGDTLCAEVALEAGARVVGALPFPPQIHRSMTSFGSEATRRRFDALLAQDRVQHFVTPLPENRRPADENAWQTLAADPTERHRIYAANGVFIARNSHGLIALWDGVGPAKPSGTAELVIYQVSGRTPEVLAGLTENFQWPESGLIQHVWTPRTSRPTLVEAAGNLREIWLPEDMGIGDGVKEPTLLKRQRDAQRCDFVRRCKSLDRFNRRVAATKPPSSKTIWKRFDTNPDNPAPPAHSIFALTRLASLRQTAADLSRGLSRQIKLRLRGTFVLMFLAAGFFDLYAHWFSLQAAVPRHQPVWLLLFLASLGISALVVSWLRNIETDELDYRTLAEALRIACQWGHAGIADHVSERYLQQVRGEVAWTRKAVQALLLPDPDFVRTFQMLPAEEQIACLKKVHACWVKDQEHYFKETRQSSHAKGRRCRRVGYALAFAGWLLAATPFMFSEDPGSDGAEPARSMATPHQSPWRSAEHPHPWVLILAGVLVVGGALIIAFGERRLYEEFGRQYSRAYDVFDAANRELDRLLKRNDIAGAHCLLRELGREALTENANWLVLRRSRPVEMPVA